MVMKSLNTHVLTAHPPSSAQMTDQVLSTYKMETVYSHSRTKDKDL